MISEQTGVPKTEIMSSGAAIFVMGPAGSGKVHSPCVSLTYGQSTFCAALLEHLEGLGRVAHLVNLDPAAEHFEHAPSKDIRDLIAVDDAMAELNYGPNGGLIFCLEYLLENMEWLTSELGEYQDEFLIVDCPGQIELYTHADIMPRIVRAFQVADYKPCALYLLESLFLQDVSKYFAGVLTATSAMLQLAIPHLNIISKMDLLRLPEEGGEKGEEGGEQQAEEEYDVEDEMHRLHRYFYPDPTLLSERLSSATQPRFYELNQALVQLIDEYDMVNFIPLDVRRAASLDNILMHIEMATQYSEGLEPKDQGASQEDEDEDEDDEDQRARWADKEYGNVD